uniref:DUF4283 domain-containing protein n=1 Tax=Tanacetum cinerariifolium TaxID=118510 RepID=A0A699L537_TANCI|nr:hypothetical protein [Tanacetum cinerariifolium]
MELCNGNGIGKIMSGVGKPLLMDNMTKERCLKQAGKLDFARVLVEVLAEDDLPCSLEISYPPIGNRPAKVGVLDVKYQWKPPLCTHCRTFGHSTLNCKIRPRTKEEIVAKNLKDALKISKPAVDGGGLQNVVDDGFTVVGKKNRPASSQRNMGQAKSGNQFQQKSSSFRRNKGVSRMSSRKNNSGKKAPVQEIKKSLVEKPVLASLYNQNFRPKVLVQGSGSAVTELIGLLLRLIFFYQNYSKYGLDPSLEDDDVAFEDGGMAADMRSEGGLITPKIGSKLLICSMMWVSNNVSCSNGTGIIVGWDPNSIRVMVISQYAQEGFMERVRLSQLGC